MEQKQNGKEIKIADADIRLPVYLSCYELLLASEVEYA